MIMGAWGMGRKRLPYDAEVDYLESTGTQWIPLGLQGEPGYDFEYKIRFTQLSSSEATGIGGCYESSASLYFGLVRTNGKLAYHYDGTSSPVVVQDVYANTDYTIAGRMISGSQYMTVNGVQGGNGSLTGTFKSSLYMRLFSVNSNSPLYSFARIYYFDLKKNGNYVRRLIPVRFTNELGQSEGAMFDRANPTVGMNPDGSPRTDGLYRNRGTGAFLWAEKQ